MSEKDSTDETKDGSVDLNEMKERLADSAKKAEAQQTARRERTVRGSHLLGDLRTRADKQNLTVTEKNGFYKITGPSKGRAVYLLKKGGRVDISGFVISSAAVIQISAEDARQKHLGKVRGQLDFSKPDDEVLQAYDEALSELVVTAAVVAPATPEE